MVLLERGGVELEIDAVLLLCFLCVLTIVILENFWREAQVSKAAHKRMEELRMERANAVAAAREIKQQQHLQRRPDPPGFYCNEEGELVGDVEEEGVGAVDEEMKLVVVYHDGHGEEAVVDEVVELVDVNVNVVKEAEAPLMAKEDEDHVEVVNDDHVDEAPAAWIEHFDDVVEDFAVFDEDDDDDLDNDGDLLFYLCVDIYARYKVPYHVPDAAELVHDVRVAWVFHGKDDVAVREDEGNYYEADRDDDDDDDDDYDYDEDDDG